MTTRIGGRRTQRLAGLLVVAAAALAGCATGIADDGDPGIAGHAGEGGGGGAGGEGGTGGAPPDATSEGADDDAAADAADAAADVSDAASDVTDAASDVTDAASDVTDAAPDVSDAAADVSDAAADVSDAAADVSDAAADVSDAAADVTDAAPDVAEAGKDAGDAGIDASDSGSDVADSAIDVADSAIDAPDAALEAGDGGALADDTCPGATIALAGAGTQARTGSVTGTTSGHDDSASGTCDYGIGGGSDAVYAFTPDVPGNATVKLTPSGSGWDPVLYVQTACASSGAEAACADNGTSGQPETVQLEVSAGTTYYVVADSFAQGKSGAFQLDVTVAPVAEDERCPGASVPWTVAPNGDRSATVTGDTSSRADEYEPGCVFGVGAPDVVYAFTADIDGTLTIVGRPLASWNLALAWSEGTCDASSLQTYTYCADAAGSGASETMQIQAEAGTTYYVEVDGRSSSHKGAFELDATLVAPKPYDGCPGETAAWTAANGTETWQTSADTTPLSDEWGVSFCTSGYAPDAVYALPIDMDGVLTVTATPTSWKLALYLASGACGTAGTMESCQAGTTAGGAVTQSVPVKKGTTQYVYVDGATSTDRGPFSLEATLGPPPASDRCPGDAAAIAFSGSPLAATVTGDTSGMTDDERGSCISTGARDAIYQFVAPKTGALKIALTPTGFDGAFYLRTGACNGAASQQVSGSCQDYGLVGGKESYTLAATQGTTYWLVVDGYSNTEHGPFTLTLSY